MVRERISQHPVLYADFLVRLELAKIERTGKVKQDINSTKDLEPVPGAVEF
jgi:hypothetical protein